MVSNESSDRSFALPEELVSFVRDNKVLVTATPLIGPHIKAHIIVVEERKEILALIKQVQSFPKSQSKQIVSSIINSVRKELMNPLEPNQNQELMNDLTLLFVVNMLNQSTKFLEAAGLFTLALRIDPDDSLPWQKRGMLDPKLLKRLKISDKLTIIP